MNYYYAGIGSREIPDDINQEFTRIGQLLASHGLTLRSGGADGADRAFEAGCDIAQGNKEIWLPWANFNDNKSDLVLESPIPSKVVEIASHIYSRWDSCSQVSKQLHARNVYQILGHDLSTPVDYVVGWSSREVTDTGGTMFGIHLALEWDIPVYNFYEPSRREAFMTKLEFALYNEHILSTIPTL